jgi:glycosyltransferase involved in cell wall biosynthesis
MSTAVSIIIPTYNRLWSLPKTIASCKQNTVKVEVIVIDDGSTDGTWEWLQSQTDIIAIKQQNLGKCWAVNKGFNIASGEYVRFLDSDDMLADNANDEQYHIARQTDADIVTAGYKTIDINDKTIGETKWTYCDDFIAQQLGECDGSHYSAFIFKKSFLADIPHRPDFAFRDDRLFILEVALKDPIIGIYDKPVLLHRIHSNERLQVTGDIKASVQNYQHYLIYKRILTELEMTGRLTDRYKKASVNTLWHLAHWMAKSHIADAHTIYKWVYELDPQFVSAENKLLASLYKNLGFVVTERLLKLKKG